MSADLDSVERIVRQCVTDRGIDPRSVFTRLRFESAASVCIECSDPDLLRSALECLQTAGVRGVSLPTPALRNHVVCVRASVAEVRRTPSHAAEQVTQVLQGECLEPLLHEDGWLLGRLADGYIGWVRDWHLEIRDPGTACLSGEATARIGWTWATLRPEPDAAAPACGETLLGTRVCVVGDHDGWCEIELPGGRRGWLPRGALRPGVADWPTSFASIRAQLFQFLGVPYVWGGRSPKGFDCSGLVQFVYGLHGVRLPRDSDQQGACGVPVTEPASGDLLFFGESRITHVAVALDAQDFLHARGEVRINSLHPGRPHHDAALMGLYRGARRVLPPGA